MITLNVDYIVLINIERTRRICFFPKHFKAVPKHVDSQTKTGARFISQPNLKNLRELKLVVYRGSRVMEVPQARHTIHMVFLEERL